MDKLKLTTQLKRIEGQLRGISTMIETDRGLVPTMQQLMAARSSLDSVMRGYIETFLVGDESRIELTREQADYILKLLSK